MKTRHDPSTKPYYRCLSCARFRHTCAGIPTRDMDQENWCEYMRDIKESAHLTNAYIAKESGVSIKTVEKIMALNYEQDIMRVTARRIELAVMGPVGKHHCYLDCDENTLIEKFTSLQVEVESLSKEIDRLAKMIDKHIGA